MPRTIRTALAGGTLALVLALLGAAAAGQPTAAPAGPGAVRVVVALDDCQPNCQRTGDFIWQVG